jgi:tetraacyldisaccharide 4'-kinase
MDDGFQNPALTKTLSIAVVDAATGFGNGRVFPAGPLREFVRDGLKRADAVVLMGEGPVEIEHPLVLKSRLVASLGPKARPKRAVAFAGIGRPEKFVATLTGLGIAVAEGVAYPDHYAYREEDIIQLRAMAERHHAELVTTEKDLARLPPRLRRDITAVPVEAVFEDEATLTRLLELALAPRATAPNRI